MREQGVVTTKDLLRSLRCLMTAGRRRAGAMRLAVVRDCRATPTLHVLRIMPNRESGSCQHERRPGTVVCLYCRHEEQLAAIGRRRARRGIGAVLLVTVVAVGVLVANRSDRSPAASPDAADPASTLVSVPSGPSASIAPEAQSIPGVPPTPGVVPAGSPLRPIVAEGRTALPGGLFAVRTGDTVEVHFDTPENRTRRRDKFERIVRETLPAVYGAVADDALSGVPAGELLAGGELPAELTERGVRLRIAEGSTLIVWPSTRPGRDGPLVVTYRATIVR